MKIKFESDLHVDKKFNFNYEPVDLTGFDVYSIAGDLGQLKVCVPYINKILEKYPNICIIHTCGNHEYYDTYMEKPENIFSELSLNNDRYHYLQNSSGVIKGIKFIGSTLWTSLNNKNPIDMNDALNGLNDYKYIRRLNGTMKFFPQYSVVLHNRAKEYIFKTLEESKEPCIVVTHHKPFCTNANYLSSAFEVELRNDLANSNKVPIIWHSGHDHRYHDIEFDFPNGITRFISNPLGYPGERTDFNSNLEVVV